MKTEIRVVAFAAILAIVCSLLLTGAELLLKPYREANEQAEEMRNYLSALEIPVADDASAKDLVEIFNKNVSVQKAGALLQGRKILQGFALTPRQTMPVAISQQAWRRRSFPRTIRR